MTTATAKIEIAFDNTSNASRRELAVAIHRALVARGFAPNTADKAKGGEVVYSRDAGEGMAVVVYSSIDWTEGRVRGNGKDAIRVAGVYTASDGKTRGVCKDTRVNRTGTVDAIVNRMMSRGAAVWTKVGETPRCRCCGAPTFIAKSGNAVCAEICWTK